MRAKTAAAFADWVAEIERTQKVDNPNAITAAEYAKLAKCHLTTARQALQGMVSNGRAKLAWRRVSNGWAKAYLLVK